MLAMQSHPQSLPGCMCLPMTCQVCFLVPERMLCMPRPSWLWLREHCLTGHLLPACFSVTLPSTSACMSTVHQDAVALLTLRSGPYACGLMKGATWGTTQSAARALRPGDAAEGLDLQTLEFEDAWMTDIQSLIQDMVPGFAASQPSQSFAKVGHKCRIASMPC